MSNADIVYASVYFTERIRINYKESQIAYLYKIRRSHQILSRSFSFFHFDEATYLE